MYQNYAIEGNLSGIPPNGPHKHQYYVKIHVHVQVLTWSFFSNSACTPRESQLDFSSSSLATSFFSSCNWVIRSIHVKQEMEHHINKFLTWRHPYILILKPSHSRGLAQYTCKCNTLLFTLQSLYIFSISNSHKLRTTLLIQWELGRANTVQYMNATSKFIFLLTTKSHHHESQHSMKMNLYINWEHNLGWTTIINISLETLEPAYATLSHEPLTNEHYYTLHGQVNWLIWFTDHIQSTYRPCVWLYRTHTDHLYQPP